MVLRTNEDQPAVLRLLERAEGLSEPRSSIYFPEMPYPRLGRGERKDCVCLWVL